MYPLATTRAQEGGAALRNLGGALRCDHSAHTKGPFPKEQMLSLAFQVSPVLCGEAGDLPHVRK